SVCGRKAKAPSPRESFGSRPGADQSRSGEGAAPRAKNRTGGVRHDLPARTEAEVGPSDLVIEKRSAWVDAVDQVNHAAVDAVNLRRAGDQLAKGEDVVERIGTLLHVDTRQRRFDSQLEDADGTLAVNETVGAVRGEAVEELVLVRYCLRKLEPGVA